MAIEIKYAGLETVEAIVGKVAKADHTHLYAGSSSAGGAATSANKVNTNLIIKLNSGTTEGTNLFTFNGSAAKTVNITPSAIGAAASSHGTHVTFTTTVPKAAGTAAVGSATTVSRSDHVHPLQTTVSGNAGTATKLATARTIALTGSVTGSGSFDGSGNLSIATTTNHTHSYLPLTGGKISGTLDITQALNVDDTIGADALCTDTLMSMSGTVSIDMSGAAFKPDQTNAYSCGSSNRLWTQLFAKTTTVSSSDRNVKKDFKTFDSNENYEKFFMDLKPTIFKYIDGTSNRDHFGYISQDVEESLYKYGFDDLSFAGFCKDLRTETVKNEDGTKEEVPVLDENGNEQYDYALRYSEFISLNTYMIQKLFKENQELKERIEKLESVA